MGCSVATAKEVANCFLSKYKKHGITPLKIQKLVYVAHGWHLALYNKPLVDDEYVEAWQYGPVFASLYHEFKYRGQLPIIEFATKVNIDMNGTRTETTPYIPKSDKETRKLIDRIWEVYKHYTGLQMSALCHQPGSPWEIARNEAPGRRNAHVPDTKIMEHYKEKLDQNRQKNG